MTITFEVMMLLEPEAAGVVAGAAVVAGGALAPAPDDAAVPAI